LTIEFRDGVVEPTSIEEDVDSPKLIGGASGKVEECP
jgi:hypothetical protein